VVKRLAFAVPGDLATPTGGYAYDRRMIAELGQLGWQIDLLNLGEGFPWPNETTRTTARTRLLATPAGRIIIVDGLALGVLPETASQLAGRNPLMALVHHPLALESGLSVEQADALRTSERTALAAVQGVVVTSAATARLVASEYGVPVANGILTTEDEAQAEARLDKGAEAVRVAVEMAKLRQQLHEER